RAQTINLIGDVRRLIYVFAAVALKTKDTEVVSDLDTVGAAQVYVNNPSVAGQFAKIPGGDNHGLGVTAGGRKDIEILIGFQHGRGPGCKRQHYVCALDVA